jgi:hypothetical protein
MGKRHVRPTQTAGPRPLPRARGYPHHQGLRVAGGGKVTLDPETGRYTIVVASEGTPPDSNTDNPWNEVLYAADQERPS